ncbi:hypothetical protein [Neoaquamicrobium sediminum]|uniref:Proteasome-associated ATPase n=2 Tax=root TaxID=1 RepID=A0AB38ZLJ9_9VIRU
MTTAPAAAGEAMPATRTIQINPAVALGEKLAYIQHLENRNLALAQQLHDTQAGNGELAAKVDELTAALVAIETKKKG